MRVVDEFGVVVTAPPTNPAMTIQEIDTSPSITTAHTLQTTANVVSNLGIGRAGVETAPASTPSGINLLANYGRFY